jgi:hypothetical protein
MLLVVGGIKEVEYDFCFEVRESGTVIVLGSVLLELRDAYAECRSSLGISSPGGTKLPVSIEVPEMNAAAWNILAGSRVCRSFNYYHYIQHCFNIVSIATRDWWRLMNSRPIAVLAAKAPAPHHLRLRLLVAHISNGSRFSRRADASSEQEFLLTQPYRAREKG